MFIHSAKYYILRTIKNRILLFWILLFPIGLATLFYFAFGNLFESDMAFNPIPVAIILDDSAESENFKTIADSLSEVDEDQLLIARYTDEKEALTLLENEEVTGIIYSGKNPSLKLNSDTEDKDIDKSILVSFLNQYKTSYSVIEQVLQTNPSKLEDVVNINQSASSYSVEKKLTKGNLNIYLQFFYNLIAMTCLYSSFLGLNIATQLRADSSYVGARRNVSMAKKIVTSFSEILGALAIELTVDVLLIIYLLFVLKLDLNCSLPLMILSCISGSLLGISLGFLIGSLNIKNETIKMCISIGISMFSCFLSGLMDDAMKMKVEEFCPLINRLNPATLISDCFYSLNIYSTYDRLTRNIITILIMAFVFSLIGTMSLGRNHHE